MTEWMNKWMNEWMNEYELSEWIIDQNEFFIL